MRGFMECTLPKSVVIVGAGPAGLAPLFAAANEGRLDELLEGGIAILSESAQLGCGSLERYSIRSDSAAKSFLDIVMRTKDLRLAELMHHPSAQALVTHLEGAVPLPLVAEFLSIASERICEIVAASKRGTVLRCVSALWTKQMSPDIWRTRYVDKASGMEHEIDSHSVVLATGGTQPQARLNRELVAGEPLLPRYEEKLVQSASIVSFGGVDLVRDRLRNVKSPKVVIVGGSSSAGAVAVRLLTELPYKMFNADSVTLMHRNPLRISYDSVEQAYCDGYKDFTALDVCSLTGKVYRFSGLRLDSRELLMKAWGLGGRARDPRLQLHALSGNRDVRARELLDEAHLLVAALGYKPRGLPVLNSEGVRIDASGGMGDRWSLVDGGCRVKDISGRPLNGLFAIGLAVGPPPSPTLGGEKGFKGQINSIWLWQHTIGLCVVESVMSRSSESRRRQKTQKHLVPLELAASTASPRARDLAHL